MPLPQCRYDQAHVQLVFPAILLARSLPMADPAALRRAREHCERELALLDAGRRDICARVRLELERQEQRFPNLEEVAARLHLSSRSLKRHLHDAGTSFRQLLGQARQRQALRLLRRPEVSLQRIALYLGYSDPTNFTRAFKRWNPRPPAGRATSFTNKCQALDKSLAFPLSAASAVLCCCGRHPAGLDSDMKGTL